jgi:hypothetical protein
MRLTSVQKQTIISQVKRQFGEDTRLWLFGSRVDDGKRGGDFDFYLETPVDDAATLVQKRLDLLVALHDTPEFEDEKIDLVIHSPLSGEPSVIAKHAVQQGVFLG